MRCVDVIREMAAPSAGVDSVALSAHLAQCPECAAWVERDVKLNRLWDATRPAVPSADDWDRIWARASETFDHQPDTDVLPMALASAPFRHRAIWIFGIAQVAAAAIILIAVLGPTDQGQPQIPQVAQASQVSGDPGALVPVLEIADGSPAIDAVEIAQGEFSVIQFDVAGKMVAQTDLAQYQSTAMVDLELFNDLEGSAGEGNVVQ